MVDKNGGPRVHFNPKTLRNRFKKAYPASAVSPKTPPFTNPNFAKAVRTLKESFYEALCRDLRKFGGERNSQHCVHAELFTSTPLVTTSHQNPTHFSSP